MVKILETNIDGCYVVETVRHEDDRGYFRELFKASKWRFFPEQSNLSVSKKHVVRGVHCTPYPKLCTCLAGKLFDVVVDLRKESVTYLKWLGVWLTPENGTQILVPEGCGHGFYSAEDGTILMYLQGGEYDPRYESSLNWRDTAVNIEWPDAPYYILSDKDRDAPFI